LDKKAFSHAQGSFWAFVFLRQSQLRCFAMIGPARISRLLSALLLAALVSAILSPRAYAADDLEQSLRSRYGNKTLVLRGFYLLGP
jgi:hypothetical protein